MRATVKNLLDKALKRTGGSVWNAFGDPASKTRTALGRYLPDLDMAAMTDASGLLSSGAGMGAERYIGSLALAHLGAAPGTIKGLKNTTKKLWQSGKGGRPIVGGLSGGGIGFDSGDPDASLKEKTTRGLVGAAAGAVGANYGGRAAHAGLGGLSSAAAGYGKRMKGWSGLISKGLIPGDTSTDLLESVIKKSQGGDLKGAIKQYVAATKKSADPYVAQLTNRSRDKHNFITSLSKNLADSEAKAINAGNIVNTDLPDMFTKKRLVNSLVGGTDVRSIYGSLAGGERLLLQPKQRKNLVAMGNKLADEHRMQGIELFEPRKVSGKSGVMGLLDDLRGNRSKNAPKAERVGSLSSDFVDEIKTMPDSDLRNLGWGDVSASGRSRLAHTLHDTHTTPGFNFTGKFWRQGLGGTTKGKNVPFKVNIDEAGNLSGVPKIRDFRAGETIDTSEDIVQRIRKARGDYNEDAVRMLVEDGIENGAATIDDVSLASWLGGSSRPFHKDYLARNLKDGKAPYSLQELRQNLREGLSGKVPNSGAAIPLTGPPSEAAESLKEVGHLSKRLRKELYDNKVLSGTKIRDEKEVWEAFADAINEAKRNNVPISKVFPDITDAKNFDNIADYIPISRQELFKLGIDNPEKWRAFRREIMRRMGDNIIQMPRPGAIPMSKAASALVSGADIRFIWGLCKCA